VIARTVTAFAPAKVNLALHVTGRRDDGYHLLDSLVVFARIGDQISAEPSEALSITVSGPNADGIPTDARNLMMKAARLLDPARGAALHLNKTLPPASGIGGGSSDAAATLRTLAELWGVAEPSPEATLSLGADLPVCMAAAPTRMQGTGDILTPVTDLPPLHIVLVNPRVLVPTPQVFANMTKRDNPAMSWPPATDSASAFIAWLGKQRNDLEAPAIKALPQIAEGLDGMRATNGCLLARKSGSGATCFGLYETADQARDAAENFSANHPDWWVGAGEVFPDAQSVRATT
jgi:4-diphosphocytidyl-2-C-methyl-D-erythritol kinase